MAGCLDKDRGLYGRLPRYIRTGDYMADCLDKDRGLYGRTGDYSIWQAAEIRTGTKKIHMH